MRCPPLPVYVFSVQLVNSVVILAQLVSSSVALLAELVFVLESLSTVKIRTFEKTRAQNIEIRSNGGDFCKNENF